MKNVHNKKHSFKTELEIIERYKNGESSIQLSSASFCWKTNIYS